MTRSGGRKSIFITGAASGIGAETARYFSKRGWYCGLYDVNSASLAQVADEIGMENCHVATLDVRKRPDWTAAVNGFGEATEGAMNVLFNNAGIGRHGWFEDVAPEDNDSVIDVNIKGVINGVHACLPLLKATPASRIVNTASTAGIVGSPQLAVYSATKFAVRGLTEALDAEFRDLDIRVTSLMPWFVDELVSDEMLPLEVAFSKSEDPLLKCKSWSCYASTLMSLCMQTSWKPARATSTRRQSFRRAGVGSSSRRLRPCSTPQNSNMGKRVSGRNSNDARKRLRAPHRSWWGCM